MNIPLPFSPRSSSARGVRTTLCGLPPRSRVADTHRSQFGGSSTWLHVILVVAAAFLVAPYFGFGAYLSGPSNHSEHAEELDGSSDAGSEAQEVASDAVSITRSKRLQQEESAPAARTDDENDLSDLDELLAP